MVTRREFEGPWVPASSRSGTVPGHDSHVVVDKSTLSPNDIFVAAGCQQGFLHVSTAVKLAFNLLEAALEINSAPTFILSVKDDSGKEYRLSGVTHITVFNHQWTAYGIGGSITGPHAASRLPAFRFIKDEATEMAFKYLSHLKEVKESEPQAAEPNPAS